MSKILFAAIVVAIGSAMLWAQVSEFGPAHARYDHARWKLKGEGIVCCPCSVPCPCRSNSQPSYGHCEATLYLHIDSGNYGAASLNGMQVVSSGGMCTNREHSAAIYFEPNSSQSQRSAMLKLWASFAPNLVADFPHVRVIPIQAEAAGGTRLSIIIPGTLEMTVDRNWGLDSPPMPLVAAQDYFANAIQYIQNVRYRMMDSQAGLDFDYSRRQANYRIVDLSDEQYSSRKMLIQFGDGKGSFTLEQLKLIRSQHLTLPQLDELQKKAVELMKSGSRMKQ